MVNIKINLNDKRILFQKFFLVEPLLVNEESAVTNYINLIAVKLLLDKDMLLRWVTVVNVLNNRKIHASVYSGINDLQLKERTSIRNGIQIAILIL